MPFSSLSLRSLYPAYALLLPVVLAIFIGKTDQRVYSSPTVISVSGLPLAKLDTEENRFTRKVLIEKMDEPLQLAVLDANRVLFIERKGQLKLYNEKTGKTKTIATIPVSTKYTDKEGKKTEAEDGLLGIALDPNFKQNNWLYLYYSPAGPASKNILARYVFKDEILLLPSKVVVLEVVVQREQCCHTGGGIAFDEAGNLYLSTGDNTSPRATAYSPSDERKDRYPWDAQKSSANTNDLRGKIIRIHPEASGKYSVPEGNLFAKGTPKTRPEIYAMGTRNPYRISVDKKTGFVYWGDVGPDSGTDSVGLGPRSYDEFNQARKPGYFGWPYFVGNNQAYWKHDFTTNTSGEKYNPEKPINTSPNNTGLEELPAAQKPLIWYPYEPSKEFPLVGTGGRSAMAGPVFYTDEFPNAKRRFPEYYNGKLFIYEWMRDWIMAVTLDAQGNYKSMERFLPNMHFSHPIDLHFGPDGDMYIIEYGTGWFQGNDDARLVKIEYNGGNRKPFAQADADKKAGAIPFNVNFTSAGTTDADQDSISYEWKITNAAGGVLKTFSEANPTFQFTKSGNYRAQFTVTDSHGEKSTKSFDLKAGNEPPEIGIDITKGNSAYFFAGQSFAYEVSVKDKEDGELSKGTIPAGKVKVTIDYLNDGSEIMNPTSGKKDVAPTAFPEGQRLISQSDCKSCHAPNKKVIGPAYKSIAQKYANDKQAIAKLTNKVISGGTGVWGDVPMAAHPQLSNADVNEMIKYILSLSAPAPKKNVAPIKGTYSPKLPDSVGDKAIVVVNVSYTDKGAPGATPITTEKKLILKNPKLVPATTWKLNNVQKFKLPDPPVELLIVMSANTWVAYQQVDLTGVSEISFSVSAPKEQLNSNGGTIEVRLDKPDGELLGETEKVQIFNGPLTEFKPEVVKARLSAVSGTHDLYFIFKNPDAKGPLFIVFSATLRNQ